MISDAVLAGALWLFKACAPDTPPDILTGIAMQESAFKPLAIGDNDAHPHQSYFPGDPNKAVDLAVYLKGQGHSIDVGLLGINYTDWQRHNIPLVAAFDECANARISGEILLGDHASAIKSGYQGQEAWRVTLSLYNTGKINAQGFGYADSVLANTRALWPRVSVLLHFTVRYVAPPAPTSAFTVSSQTPSTSSLQEAIKIAKARQLVVRRVYAEIERAARARAQATAAPQGKP